MSEVLFCISWSSSFCFLKKVTKLEWGHVYASAAAAGSRSQVSAAACSQLLSLFSLKKNCEEKKSTPVCFSLSGRVSLFWFCRFCKLSPGRLETSFLKHELRRSSSSSAMMAGGILIWLHTKIAACWQDSAHWAQQAYVFAFAGISRL